MPKPLAVAPTYSRLAAIVGLLLCVEQTAVEGRDSKAVPRRLHRGSLDATSPPLRGGASALRLLQGEGDAAAAADGPYADVVEKEIASLRAKIAEEEAVDKDTKKAEPEGADKVSHRVIKTEYPEASTQEVQAISDETDDAIAEMERMMTSQEQPNDDEVREPINVPYHVQDLALKASPAKSTLVASTKKSESESYGFMSVTEEEWTRRKNVHIAQMRKEAAIGPDKEGAKGSHWWQLHYEPSFHCSYAERLGNAGEGGKWVCDPYRIKQAAEAGEPCLVYSVGSRGEFSFERDVQEKISSNCEVHVFDPEEPDKYPTGSKAPSTVNYHLWPLGRRNQKVMDITAKSLATMTKDLGHSGRRIDVLKIDCEGCEWTTYKDWFKANVDIRQILVELHGKKLPGGNWSIAHDFYKHLHAHGYVVVAKEPNTQGCGGDCIEYGFLKLDPKFDKLSN